MDVTRATDVPDPLERDEIGFFARQSAISDRSIRAKDTRVRSGRSAVKLCKG